MTLPFLFPTLLILTILFIAITFAIDFKNHLKAKKEFNKKYGHYIGQTLKVIDQNKKEGSILEHNLPMHDNGWEKGIMFYGCKKGDMIKITEYPKFNPFGQKKGPFEKT